MRVRLVLVLLLAALGAVALAGCGGAQEASPLPETVEGTVPTEEETTAETETAETETGETETTETETTETETAETETTETETTGGDDEGNPDAGTAVFKQNCGSCHTLEAAGTEGNIGPNLDESKPSYDKAVDRITNGKGGMPPFKGQLSEQQIKDVAAYIVESTKG